MIRPGRCTLSLVVLLAVATCAVADDTSWKVEVGKAGKAATALVEVKARQSYGSAFCIHSSGLFLTNAHVVEPTVPFSSPGVPVAPPEITLVLNADQLGEKAYPARVVRADREIDLALVRIEGVKDLPVLPLGSDEKLTELEEVVAVGFPFGTALAPDRKGYPAVSVNAGSVTSLRRKDDRLHRIQLDVTLNPGNSGGPVLDRNGKVVGVVVAGVQGAGINFAIPVSTVNAFVARPEVQFDPPTLDSTNLHKALPFEARVVSILPTTGAFKVDLTLKPARGGKERTFHMEAAEDRFKVSAVPLPPPPGALPVRLLARFEDGAINATALDRAFMIGKREVKLSDVGRLQLKPGSGVLLEGKPVDGALSGLDAVPVTLGGQSLKVNLSKAVELRCSPVADSNVIWYTLQVRQNDKEVYRHCEGLLVEGLIPAPAATMTTADIRPPKLDADKVERKLAGSVSDVVVGGGGRYLILQQPTLHKLAVFDVSAADLVGHIPLAEDDAKIAAGLDDLLVVLPHAGTIERWSLRTLERDVAATLPVKGIIRSIAMGSASRGPLLVHSATGSEELAPTAFSLVNVDTMRLAVPEIKLSIHMTALYRDLWHIRASANGKLFGCWCTSYMPCGMGVIEILGNEIKSSYAHGTYGHVVPGPVGKLLFTAAGLYAPPTQLIVRQQADDAMIPSCQGDCFVRFPRPGTRGAVSVHARGEAKPLATFADFDPKPTNEDTIKHDFTFDKRVHLIPDAKVVITIPASDDRVVLYRLGG